MLRRKPGPAGMEMLARIAGWAEPAGAPAQARLWPADGGAGVMPVHFVHGREYQSLVDYLAQELGASASAVKSYHSLQEVQAVLLGPAPFCLVVVMHPLSSGETLDDVIAFAKDNGARAYVAYVAEDVSAVDFRRLLNTGAGEWFPKQSAPLDLMGLLERLRQHPAAARAQGECLFTSFIPGGGGAGASTLAAETAVCFARRSRDTEPRACVVDLNLQYGNVCDLLDVAPQLDLKAIAADPERIDDQLLAAFRSRTGYGVDVFAPPKNAQGLEAVTPEAVFALCNALSQRYDFINADLPPHVYPWTDEIIRNSDAGVIAATCSVPSALRVGALLRRLEAQHVRPQSLLLAVNRFPGGLLSRGLTRAEFERALPDMQSVYIAQDDALAAECANAGRPMVASARRRPVVRGIEALADILVARRDRKRGAPGAPVKRARSRLWGGP